MVRRLTRPRGQGAVGGVCAGLAQYVGMDVSLVRALWLVLSIVPGAVFGGVLAYLAAWIIIPEGPAEAPTEGPRLTRSVTDKRIGGVCGGIAEYYKVDPTPVRLLAVILSFWPGCIVGGVLAYVIAWLIIPSAVPLPSVPEAHPGERDSVVFEAFRTARVRYRSDATSSVHGGLTG